MLGIFLGAAILGIIIGIMEQDEFPGLGKMLLCVLAAIIPAAIINTMLPSELFVVGLLAGAICAAFAISFLTGMTVKRAAIAASIFFVCQIALSVAIEAMFS